MLSYVQDQLMPSLLRSYTSQSHDKNILLLFDSETLYPDWSDVLMSQAETSPVSTSFR